MPISSEALKQDLDRLTGEQLQQVAEFIAFLKFRDKRDRLNSLDTSQLATLVTFGEEDRVQAEVGINDYAQMLHQEDRL